MPPRIKPNPKRPGYYPQDHPFVETARDLLRKNPNLSMNAVHTYICTLYQNDTLSLPTVCKWQKNGWLDIPASELPTNPAVVNLIAASGLKEELINTPFIPPENVKSHAELWTSVAREVRVQSLSDMDMRYTRITDKLEDIINKWHDGSISLTESSPTGKQVPMSDKSRAETLCKLIGAFDSCYRSMLAVKKAGIDHVVPLRLYAELRLNIIAALFAAVDAKVFSQVQAQWVIEKLKVLHAPSEARFVGREVDPTELARYVQSQPEIVDMPHASDQE